MHMPTDRPMPRPEDAPRPADPEEERPAPQPERINEKAEQEARDEEGVTEGRAATSGPIGRSEEELHGIHDK